MGLTPVFDASALMKGVYAEIQRMDELILANLNRVGLEFVRNARTKADFTDRTGNLRSSIGYVILKNGQVVDSNFEDSSQGTDKATGKAKGFDYAMANVEANIGYVLIVVAGMEYAVYVESMGYDVITGSSMTAEDELKELFDRLGKMK